jgi:hypothetical protein
MDSAYSFFLLQTDITEVPAFKLLRSEFLTVTSVKVFHCDIVFWDVTLCRLVDIDWHFRET